VVGRLDEWEMAVSAKMHVVKRIEMNETRLYGLRNLPADGACQCICLYVVWGV